MRPVTHFVLIGGGELLPGRGSWCPLAATPSGTCQPGTCTRCVDQRRCDTACVFLCRSRWSHCPCGKAHSVQIDFFFSSPWHVSRFICRTGCQTVSYRHLTPLTLPSHLWSLFWWHTGCFPKMFQSEWWGLGVFSVVLWEDRLLLSWCFYQLL